MSDEIVKVKKSDLERLIDANSKAYQILDDITMSASDVAEKVSQAFSALEDVPTEMSEIIVEDDEEEEGK